MKIGLYTFIFIFLIIYLSCNQSQFCKNELELINVTDSVPVIPLDFRYGTHHIDTLKNAFDYDICCNYVTIGLPLNIDNNLYSIPIKYYIEHSSICKNCPTVCSRDEFIILVNTYNQIFAESSIVNSANLRLLLDTLHNEKINNLLNNGNRNYPRLYMQWDLKTDTTIIKKIIWLTVECYLKATNDLSMKKFNKTLCRLSNSELNYVKKNYPYHLEFFIPEIIDNDEFIDEEFVPEGYDINKLDIPIISVDTMTN